MSKAYVMLHKKYDKVWGRFKDQPTFEWDALVGAYVDSSNSHDGSVYQNFDDFQFLILNHRPGGYPNLRTCKFAKLRIPKEFIEYVPTADWITKAKGGLTWGWIFQDILK